MREYRKPLCWSIYELSSKTKNAPDATAAGSTIREFGGAFKNNDNLSKQRLRVWRFIKKFKKTRAQSEEKRLVKMFEDRMKKVGGKSGRPSPLTRKGREKKPLLKKPYFLDL